MATTNGEEVFIQYLRRWTSTECTSSGLEGKQEVLALLAHIKAEEQLAGMAEEGEEQGEGEEHVQHEWGHRDWWQQCGEEWHHHPWQWAESGTTPASNEGWLWRPADHVVWSWAQRVGGADLENSKFRFEGG